MGKWKNAHPQKIELTKAQVKLIHKHWETMTNPQLADLLGVKITWLRYHLYKMGLRKMEMEYWTRPMINYLVKHYKTTGDVELAEYYQQKWPKGKPWTNKHIEKKRNYLKLSRTAKEIAAIQQRNVDNGRFLLCPVKRWDTTGRAKEGEIRYWRENSGRMVPRIKINGVFIHWARWRWQQKHGPVPPDMNVVFKDGDPNNRSLKNLELLSDAELSRKNTAVASVGLSDKYIAGVLSHNNIPLRDEILQNKDLIEVKRLQLLLNRKIKSYEQQQSNK